MVANAAVMIMYNKTTLGQSRQDSFSIFGLTIPEFIVIPTNSVPLLAKTTSQSATINMNSEIPSIE